VTAAVLDRPGTLFAEAAERAGGDERRERGERPGGENAVAGGRLTLEELLSSALHQARANGSTECPVCHARMTYTRAGEPAGVECGGCGSRLS
jgi:hypothetical protein